MAGLIHLELLTDFFNKIGQKETSRRAIAIILWERSRIAVTLSFQPAAATCADQ